MLVPKGFRFAGVACGIKKSGKPDLTLIASDANATAAGVYTTNLVRAAPVTLDRERTPTDAFRVVVVNSGNANACTGDRGMDDAREMTRLAAQAIGCRPEQALVMSTGVIGHFLPMDKIARGVNDAHARLGSTPEAFMDASRGILTTDQGTKTLSVEWKSHGTTFRIAGMCKGAGMIGPKMATMLAVITTDAALSPDDARHVLQEVADESFNCISVEGHMSTNDTLLLLASGAARKEPLAGDELTAFTAALKTMAIELAKQIPADGEGATHVVCLRVTGLRTRDEAREIARRVTESALVKTAIAGGDPNWGRIVSAAGYAGVPFDPAKVGLTINGHELYRAGAPVAFDAKTVSASIKSAKDVDVALSFGEGSASCRFWASDLTVDYVKFNADYTT